MKSSSELKPNKFKIEKIEKDKIAVSFFDNINEEIDILEDQETQRYVYDTYKIIINNRDNLFEEIKNNYDIWLQFAKDCEHKKLAEEIRTKRDKLLNETDWTQVIDTVLNTKKQEEYKSYRQELRDITEQEGFPYKVVFPLKPTE